jgi:hypothetical protein
LTKKRKGNPKPKPRTKKPRDIKAWCKELYFTFYAPEEIVKETKISLRSLYNWIYGRGENEGWRTERLQYTRQVIKDIGDRNAVQAHDVVRMGFTLLRRALKHRLDQVDKDGHAVAPTIREASTISSIVTDVTGLLRLAAGVPIQPYDEPSDGKAGEGTRPALPDMSLEEIQSVIRNDPFFRMGAKGDDYVGSEFEGGDLEGAGSVQRHPDAGVVGSSGSDDPAGAGANGGSGTGSDRAAE